MIYFDNAATAKPNARAVARAQVLSEEDFFNPSAVYRGGLRVQARLKSARERLLSYLAPQGGFDLIFTSSGSEADNQAVFSAGKRGNVVLTAGEHAAVYESCKELKNRGVEVRLAPLNRDGSVKHEAFLALVDEKTSLAACIHVNNETGALNDVAALAKGVKAKSGRTLFLADGVQAFLKIPFRLTPEIDFYAVSAHKIGGVKGAGALYKNKKCNLSPLIYGGGQEGNLRSGTENAFAILAFAVAAEEKFSSLEADFERVKKIKNRILQVLPQALFSCISPEAGSPYILSLAAKNLRGEVLLHLCDDRGLLIGKGSACSSKKPYSRVIEACGRTKEELNGVIRLSFSPENTVEEGEEAAKILTEEAEKLLRTLKK